eukprot:CAMPEP_0197692628 /NCGR_PEP_ID=MMETSP1338-20131121/111384_1 /TAXON_ID=43686 ORGANISM="Pelagodinium beii, Strain RCC1491" /NCGR_SAMPLE_ID=MMETSP1338 /ASSEMBLY_ACC=CAM_ASM_000754 /LENGTH=131 /DNA_ID=CAMNT_0043275303 /DNA_START=51 /DNA_END=443 /DNA_ORIENTATION=+
MHPRPRPPACPPPAHVLRPTQYVLKREASRSRSRSRSEEKACEQRAMLEIPAANDGVDLSPAHHESSETNPNSHSCKEEQEDDYWKESQKRLNLTEDALKFESDSDSADEPGRWTHVLSTVAPLPKKMPRP